MGGGELKPSYWPENHPHRPQSPVDGEGGIHRQPRAHVALIVLPIGVKAPVIVLRGLTVPKSSLV